MRRGHAVRPFPGRVPATGPTVCRKATFTQAACVNVAFLQLAGGWNQRPWEATAAAAVAAASGSRYVPPGTVGRIASSRS